QGLMWKEFTPEGVLKYPNFLATTLEIIPMHIMRATGGALYLAGAIIMTVNLVKTMRQGKLRADEAAEAAVPGPIVVHETVRHRRLERKPVLFMVLALVAILIGGIVEMIPTFTVTSNVPKIESVRPYTALELQGRDLYIREGCVNCHSQTARPFRSETSRHGEYSNAGELRYDRLLLWGSKRRGAGLQRIGGNYPYKWKFVPLLDPTITAPAGIVPAYPWLIAQQVDNSLLSEKMHAMRVLGVPYTADEIAQAVVHARQQAAT